MALTDEAIDKIRELIKSGQLLPGSRLPREADLSVQLGLSRNSLREAIRALVMVGVIDVRHGDGSYVSSLEPRLLFEGFGFAVDLLQDSSLLQVVEVRRLLEPPATGLAATRMSADRLNRLARLLIEMEAVHLDMERLTACDVEFHAQIMAATNNEALASVLHTISGKTVRARIWRGALEARTSRRTIAEHRAIYKALAAGDARLAEAAALIHVTTSETWLRGVLDEPSTSDQDATEEGTR